MIGIIRYCRLCILLYAGFSFNKSFASSDIEKADSLFSIGSFFEASVYYSRADFLSTTPVEKFSALTKKAECYRLLKDYFNARETLSKIDPSTLNDSSLYILKYKQALYSYLLKDYGECESHLLQITYFITDSTLQQNFIPLYALTLNELYRWNEASEKLKTWNKHSSSLFADSIKVYYEPSEYPKLKDPAKAQKLSVVPGLGQMYAGEFFWDGFTNVSLQAAFLGYTVWSVYTGFYATAVIIGYSFLQKFYTGGITHVEYLVKKSNFNKTRSYNDKLRGFILRHSFKN